MHFNNRPSQRRPVAHPLGETGSQLCSEVFLQDEAFEYNTTQHYLARPERGSRSTKQNTQGKKQIC